MGQTDVDLTNYATVKDLNKIDLTPYLKSTEFVGLHNNSTGLKYKNLNVDFDGTNVLGPSYIGGFNIKNGSGGAWSHFNSENKGVNFIRGKTEFSDDVDFKGNLRNKDGVIIGAKGDKGDKGDTGSQGIAGVKGDTGSQGIPGIKGDTGSQGIAGVKGDTGSQGIPGIKGDTGSQGIAGVKGDTGSQGIAGVKGDKGDIGATGIQGIQGIPGIPGSFTTNSAAYVGAGPNTSFPRGLNIRNANGSWTNFNDSTIIPGVPEAMNIVNNNIRGNTIIHGDLRANSRVFTPPGKNLCNSNGSVCIDVADIVTR